jgi:hypothetical protein
VRAPRIALAVVVVSSTAQVQAQAQAQAQPTAEHAPNEATCRGYVEQGLAKTNHDEARELFHAARVRCANVLGLVFIARTYELQGDLPRALAYIEEFLRVADAAHDARAEMEKAAAALRERVPAAQRVSVAAELSAKTASLTPAPAPAPPVKSTTSTTANHETTRLRLIKEVEDVDYPSRVRRPAQLIDRARGVFIGVNGSYATRATLEIRTDTMTGRSDLPTVFAADVQAGYRLFPYVSVALASQMVFNLKPTGADSARELSVFAQATGHYELKMQWDFNFVVAPGYTVVLIPDADDASGFAFRWGGGPMFHLNNHVSFAAELSHQLGFQKTSRTSGDVDMQTTFVSLHAGVRVRL